MHKPEAVFENEIHKILWNLEIQKDLPIQKNKLCLD